MSDRHRAGPRPSLAADLDRALVRRAASGAPGGTASRRIAGGAGWDAYDVLCTAGPEDRPYEERHSRVGIAVVAAGTFRYRAESGRALLTPGSLLLGNAGQPFECGHEHGRGDRCVAFQYDRELFERIAAEAGADAANRRFRVARLPPLRTLAPFVARAAAGAVDGSGGIGGAAQAVDPGSTTAASWEELAFDLAARTVELAGGLAHATGRLPLGAEAKIAAAVRRIERDPAEEHPLAALAAEAGLSRYHFLRSFERATGVTPHQFVLRARLRAAALALRLASDTRSEKVVEVAYGTGFGDLSNFNRTFRAEFGASPTAYRSASAPQRDVGGTIPRSLE